MCTQVSIRDARHAPRTRYKNEVTHVCAGAAQGSYPKRDSDCVLCSWIRRALSDGFESELHLQDLEWGHHAVVRLVREHLKGTCCETPREL
jgi:hypothetical protein